ncbi:MAG: Sec-independent protein translocase protein TatB [Sulfuriferula sp.]
MFDIGFSEIVVIGVVALVVIGPERLPKVARTVGLLVGRMQRYMATVKADISQEIQLDELKRSGEAFKQSLSDTGQQISQEIQQTTQAVTADLNMDDTSVADVTTPIDTVPTQVQGELALDVPSDETTTAHKTHDHA